MPLRSPAKVRRAGQTKPNTFSPFLPKPKPRMDQIRSLLTLFSEADRNALKTATRDGTASQRLIYLLLCGEDGEDELLGALKINRGSFAKTQTQAKDYLIDRLQAAARTPYDGVQVVQSLVMSGQLATASKLYRSLERDFERKQKWQLLDILYIEGFRIGQMTGDIKFAASVADKRRYYADKHAAYVHLYGEVMVEMFRAEKFGERREDREAYVGKVRLLLERAHMIGHHVLIHNALLILYHQYSRFYNNPDDTWAIVQQISETRRKYRLAMNEITDATTRLNVINFLCIHAGYGEPTSYLTETMRHIDAGGVIARANLIYALLGYYLSEGDMPMVSRYLGELELTQDKTYFAPFRSVVLAIQCFMVHDLAGFERHLQLFYADPNHIHLPDSEVVVRILELLVLHSQGERQLYRSKTAALRTYFNRNLNADRYADEYNMLLYLTTPSSKNRRVVEEMRASRYRNSRMLSKYILEFHRGDKAGR